MRVLTSEPRTQLLECFWKTLRVLPVALMVAGLLLSVPATAQTTVANARWVENADGEQTHEMSAPATSSTDQQWEVSTWVPSVEEVPALQRTVSIGMRSVSVAEGISRIAAKVGLSVSYLEETTPSDQTITLEMEAVPAREALVSALRGTDLRLVQASGPQLVLVPRTAPQEEEVSGTQSGLQHAAERISVRKLGLLRPAKQQGAITGTVTDSLSGEPIPGVNVVVAGTQLGAATNSQGQYTISGVEPGAYTLEATFVGYASKTIEGVDVSEGETTVVDFVMRSAEIGLEDVVVTALGVEREQRSITSSIGTVSGDEVAQVQEINVANSLAGRVSGVQVQSAGSGPGGSARVIIRGYSSLGGNNQPLYVVDGVPIDNSNRGSAGRWGGYDRGDGIQNINPNDIEEISVLKGPSAAALYGQRGANGVVLITTKSGEAQQGIGVQLNSSVTAGSPAVWPNWQNEYGLGNSGQHRFFRDNDGSVRSRSEWQAAGQPDWTPQVTTAADGPQHPKSWGPRMGGSEVYNWDGELTSFSPQSGNAKDFFRQQLTVDNTLAFSGGNQQTTFRLSLQDMRNQAILPTHELTRQGANLRASHQVTDRLSAEGKVNYVRQEVHNRPALSDDQENVFYQFRGMPRNVKLSNLTDFTIGPDEQIVGYSEDIMQEGYPRHWSNAGFTEQPYWIVNNVINEDTRQRVMGFVSLRYEFTDWITAQVRAETDFYADRRHNHAAIGTRTPGQGDGTLSEQVHRFREDNLEAQVTGERSITENLSASVSVGGNYKRDFFNNTNYSGEQLAAPDLYVIGNAQIQNPGYDLLETEIQSLYAFGQFNWRDFWYVDWTVRNDWSSTLPTDNNSFLYPSFGTNLVFTDVFDLPDVLSYGSVRASWAQAGSSGDPYQLTGTYGIASQPHLGQPGAQFQDNVPFTDLQNELTTSIEVGADLRFLNGRMRLDGAWYTSTTENQILSIPVSTASGYFSRSVNAGEIKNTGIEFMLEGTPIMNEDFQWDIRFNYGSNTNEVIELVEGIDRFRLGDARNVAVFADPEQPYGSIYTTTARWVRDDEGNRLIDPSGLPIRESGSFRIGNAMPDWTGGISNTFSYKGVVLSTMIDIQRGGEIYSVSNTYEAIYGTTEATLEGRDGTYVAEGVVAEPDGNGGWESTGEQNTTQVRAEDYWNRVAPSEGNVVTEAFLNDGTYVKMREMRLSYGLPSSLVQPLGLNRVRLSVVGKNLFYFVRDTDGFAPDAHNRNVGPGSLGQEDMSWPSIRSIGFNVNLGL